MSLSILLLLRLVHVIIGVAWAGSVFFIALFLMPTLRAIGPASGPVMAQLAGKQKMSVFLMLFAVLTILSGGALLWNDMHTMGSAWMGTGPGRTFSAGAAIAIFTGIAGGAVNAPAGKRLGELGAAVRARGGPPSPEQAAEMARLQARLNMATKVAAVLLLLATAAMSIARYVP